MGASCSRALRALLVIASGLWVLGCGGGLGDDASCADVRRASQAERVAWLDKHSKGLGIDSSALRARFRDAVIVTCSYKDLIGGDRPLRPLLYVYVRSARADLRISAARHRPARKVKPSKIPTRLLAGPVVFRIVGRKTPKGSDALHGWGYLSLFRLDHDSYVSHPPLSLSRRGRFAFGARFNVLDIVSLGTQRKNRHCFLGPQPTGTNDLLDPIRVGQPLLYTLQPFRTRGRTRLGQEYVRHPIMHTSNITLTTPTAVKLLKQIGCLAASREFFAVQ